jgi:surface antigen
MPSMAQSRRWVLTLIMAALLSGIGFIAIPATQALADDGGYPNATMPCIWDPYKTSGLCKNNAGVTTYEWGPDHGNENTIYSGRGYAYRNCTDYVAWKLQSLGVADSWTRGLGNGGQWYDNAGSKSGLSRGTTPAVGAAAVVPADTPGFGGYGHVAYVEAVNSNGTITVSEYNGDLMGDYDTRVGTPAAMHFTEFVYFADKMTSQPVNGGGSGGTAPQIFAIKRTTDPSGVRQVYAGTNTAVTEGWWIPGGDGVHLHEVIRIDQHNIVGFDKVNLPDNTQAVYTAVSDGVWESWWKPDGSSGQAKIVTGLSGVKGVITYNDTEGGQFVHHLYILAGNGPYEAWWKDGGDGVHLSLLTSISGGVTFTMSIGPDGAMQLYVAVPTWVYEVWWHPGLNDIHVGTVINIAQGDIRSLSKGDNLSDGGQLLYTGTSTTAWQSYWNTGTGVSNGTIATGQVNLVQVKKTVTADTHQLYVADSDHVQEYWWNSTGSGGGELIRIPQNNIGAIDKVNDGAAQELYTGASNWVYETWWGGGYSPSTNALFSVAH